MRIQARWLAAMAAVYVAVVCLWHASRARGEAERHAEALERELEQARAAAAAAAAAQRAHHRRRHAQRALPAADATAGHGESVGESTERGTSAAAAAAVGDETELVDGDPWADTSAQDTWQGAALEMNGPDTAIYMCPPFCAWETKREKAEKPVLVPWAKFKQLVGRLHEDDPFERKLRVAALKKRYRVEDDRYSMPHLRERMRELRRLGLPWPRDLPQGFYLEEDRVAERKAAAAAIADAAGTAR
mmetsp:Transcript_28444/g.92898  ORF Transcript_28444/g.92898 Transcript_28444/m.92898 type:complete len:246 (+) Transcript_28444:41-778(+)